MLEAVTTQAGRENRGCTQSLNLYHYKAGTYTEPELTTVTELAQIPRKVLER